MRRSRSTTKLWSQNYSPAGSVVRELVYHKDTPGSTTCFFTESKKTVLAFISRRTHSPPSKGCTLCAGCSRYGACSGDGEICTHSVLFVCDGFTDHSSSLTLAHPRVCTTLAHSIFSCQAWTVRATIPPPPLCKSGALPNELTARRATTESRTRDLHRTRMMLYQLSYCSR